MKNGIFILLAFTILFLFTSFSYLVPDAKQLVVVIDAGHGGKDPGCMTKDAREKKVTLAIAQKLGKLLSDSLKDVKVVYTRYSDSFVELHDRAKIANNQKADIFISIHCNHNKSTSPNGSETYVMGLHKSKDNLDVAKRENSAIEYEDEEDKQEGYDGIDPNSAEWHIILETFQNANLQSSLKLAADIEKHLAKRKKVNKSRGVKQAGFLVLWKTTMPSVLVETGFLSNAAERDYLQSDSGRQEIALSIYKAVKDYNATLQ